MRIQQPDFRSNVAMYYPTIKRVVDVAGAMLGLALGAAPMIVIAVLIRRTMGPPVLHRAVRPGLHGRPFILFKFRTMAEMRDQAGQLLPDRERITPLGRTLRRTSLDELPQLINVLRGDMSLVGPRPLMMQYLPLYTPSQARRHEVKPGITGLAQVAGRNQLTWDDRFVLDVEYVDHVSFLRDVRILLETVVRVVRRDHVSRDGDLDLPLFTGSAGRQP